MTYVIYIAVIHCVKALDQWCLCGFVVGPNKKRLLGRQFRAWCSKCDRWMDVIFLFVKCELDMATIYKRGLNT